jgi:hypothetical protein
MVMNEMNAARKFSAGSHVCLGKRHFNKFGNCHIINPAICTVITDRIY